MATPKTAVLKEQLNKMIDKTFIYGGRIHCVKSIKISDNEEKVTIVTNLEAYDRKIEAIGEFLSHWQLHVVQDAPAIYNQLDVQMAQALQKDSTTFDRMLDVLEDNITKVKEDPKYIPQATAINNNVNSIINLQKLKMDVYNKYRSARRA